MTVMRITAKSSTFMQHTANEPRSRPMFQAVRFMVEADANPGLLPRLVQHFARRDLVPDRMWSHRNGESVHVELAMSAMPVECVHTVEGNLRQTVGVRNVVRLVTSELKAA
jgi:hypothetical protein